MKAKPNTENVDNQDNSCPKKWVAAAVRRVTKECQLHSMHENVHTCHSPLVSDAPSRTYCACFAPPHLTSWVCHLWDCPMKKLCAEWSGNRTCPTGSSVPASTYGSWLNTTGDCDRFANFFLTAEFSEKCVCHELKLFPLLSVSDLNFVFCLLTLTNKVLKLYVACD